MITIEKRLENLGKEIVEIKEILKNGQLAVTPEFNGFISQADAIEKYKLSKDWFWRRRKSGQLPFKKLGARVFYAQKDLFNLLEEAA